MELLSTCVIDEIDDVDDFDNEITIIIITHICIVNFCLLREIRDFMTSNMCVCFADLTQRSTGLSLTSTLTWVCHSE